MIMLDPLWPCLEFLELHFAIPGVHPDRRAVLMKRERAAYVRVRTVEHLPWPLSARLFENQQAADEHLFLCPEDLIERPQVFIDVHQITKDTAVHLIPRDIDMAAE